MLPWLGSIALFAATCLIYPVHFDPRLNGSGYETIALARSIAFHHSFADPYFAMPTGPSAQLAPGFPAFIALLMPHAKDMPTLSFWLGWIATGAIGMQLAALPWIAQAMELGYAAGFLSSIAWLVCRVTIFERWETQFVALFCLLLGLLMYWISAKPGTTWQAAAVGAFWGFVLLWNPAGVLVLLAWLVYLHFGTRTAMRQKLALAGMAVLIVSPWVVRNYVAFHHVFLVRDNLGLELQVSNNDCSMYAFDLNRFTGCYSVFHPNLNKLQAQRVAELGEFKYNQYKKAEATHWIAGHKGEFAMLTAKRTTAYWAPSIVEYPWEEGRIPVSRHIITVLTALSAIGLFLLWKENRAAFWVFGLWLVFFPPVYYVTQYNERFRVPILWATFLPAGYFLVAVAKRARYKRQSAPAATGST